jgi:uncharacterized protein YyaL (SSP411 family)
MCQGGIYDHIGGGFARYTVDAEWLVPHFEKMLYDNAQFVSLLSEVYRETQNPLFAARIAETVEWVRRDLGISHLSHTAFAAAMDADSEGVEGKYYVWTADEIQKILFSNAEDFKKVYDVTSFGNWENVNILNRLKNPEYYTEEEEKKLGEWRRKLRDVRDKRVPPQLDNKILADNNGLMIAALAKAGFALGRQEWVEMAEDAFRFILNNMTDSESRLYHSWCSGIAKHEGLLEDYANMADAALALYHVTQETRYLEQAAAFVTILDDEFLDTANGGYFMSSSRTADTLIRPKSAHDGAVPSGNGTIVGVLARLYQLTGIPVYGERARKTAEAFFGEVAAHFFPFATLLSNSDLVLNPMMIVIALPEGGQGGQGKAGAFDMVLRQISMPGLVKTVLRSGKDLPASHPAFGKASIGGKPTAYICFGQQCLAPVTTAEELEELLHHERGRRYRSVANDG